MNTEIEHQRRPDETDAQFRWRVERAEQDRREREARHKRALERLEWERSAKQREEQEAAEQKRQADEALQRQRERQERELAEQQRRQDIAREAGTPGPIISPEAEEAWKASVRARNSAPDRTVTCPRCGGFVKLVGGKLPETHQKNETDAYGWLVTVACNPYSY